MVTVDAATLADVARVERRFNDDRGRRAVPIDTLWHAVPAFPTVSEVWLRLLEADRGL